jgi:predicted ATPase
MLRGRFVDRYTVATIDRRLSSIGYYHKQARHSLPTKAPEVERTMHGIRRAKGIAPKGKSPIPTPLLRRIEQGLDILRTSLHNCSERHQSMRAVFRHSWQLLSEAERCTLAALSAFRGGFHREAAM